MRDQNRSCEGVRMETVTYQVTVRSAEQHTDDFLSGVHPNGAQVLVPRHRGFDRLRPEGRDFLDG